MSVLAELQARGLTRADIKRFNRELLKDKSYQLCPLGQEAAAFLRHKRKRLTDASYRDVEATLDKFCRDFEDLYLADFEPPVGTRRLEEFLDDRWGDAKARTYNKNLTWLREFFKYQCLRGNMQGDPTLAIERAKARGVYRTTFSPDQRRAILAENHELRDRIALRLLLDYALRKGSLKVVQFQHFDHVRKRLTIFAKGGKVRAVPIPDVAFWHDLERLILDTQAQPHWYLLPTSRGNQSYRRLVHDKPMADHGLHNWWYRCLQQAGIVPEGASSGERMHKARHTAGQRLLDHSGNLKAVQRLLGHSSISTTGDIYVDWDEDALAASLQAAFDAERNDDE